MTPTPTPEGGLSADNRALVDRIGSELRLQSSHDLGDLDILLNAARAEARDNNRIGTHGVGCHTWGPRHYECLLREYEALAISPPRTPGAVSVFLAEREDGGLRVWSDDEPGLVLSGADPKRVGADIWAAIQALRAGRDGNGLVVSAPPQSTVEEIARIIEPELWRWVDEGKRPARSQRIQDSLTKARQIASLHSRGGRGDLGVSRDLTHAPGVKLEGEG